MNNTNLARNDEGKQCIAMFTISPTGKRPHLKLIMGNKKGRINMQKREKNSFILYHDICEMFTELSDAQAGMLIKEIVAYSKNTTQPNQDKPNGLSGLLATIFIPFKSHIDRDFLRWQDRKCANQENGKRGGRPKSQITQNNPTKGVKVNVNVNVNESIKSANDFEVFWQKYPNKKDKLKAKKAFEKVKPTLEEILLGLERYISGKESWKEFKLPATWLNGECWNDEYALGKATPPADGLNWQERNAKKTKAAGL